MINEISINSNNAIQLSRSQLLSWVNELLGTSVNKIEQLGTGAFYCQLLDLLYPGKVQLNKVNFKAKNDYEYINNFKLLQQHFTKFGILKNIEVERLVKCKYQDNLQFLQWFKKIFDNLYTTTQQTSISMRRSTSDNDSHFSLEKENKKPPTRALNFFNVEEKGLNEMLRLQFAKDTGGQRTMHSSSSRSKIDDKVKRQNQLIIKPSTDRINSIADKSYVTKENSQSELIECQNQNLIQCSALKQQSRQPYYSPSKYIEKQIFFKSSTQSNGFCNEQREFYMKKFKEIQHLLQIWQKDQHCQKLTTQIRKVIMIPPSTIGWKVDDETGEIIYPNDNIEQPSQFDETIQEKQQKIEQGSQ